MKNDGNLFFTCSLIEFIGRQQKLPRGAVVRSLGEQVLRRIYKYADEFIHQHAIPQGNFDNAAKCHYTVPDYWTIGKVYSRLIEDVMTDDPIATLQEVYASWISTEISRYNSDFYYQSRDYIAECYRAGTVL